MLDETSHAFEIIRSVSHMSIMIIFVYSIDIEKIRMQSNIMFFAYYTILSRKQLQKFELVFIQLIRYATILFKK